MQECRLLTTFMASRTGSRVTACVLISRATQTLACTLQFASLSAVRQATRHRPTCSLHSYGLTSARPTPPGSPCVANFKGRGQPIKIICLRRLLVHLSHQAIAGQSARPVRPLARSIQPWISISDDPNHHHRQVLSQSRLCWHWPRASCIFSPCA